MIAPRLKDDLADDDDGGGSEDEDDEAEGIQRKNSRNPMKTTNLTLKYFKRKLDDSKKGDPHEFFADWKHDTPAL
ncbi:sodium channel protein type 4 subunit alpha B [Acrasis kona]|uniref:Sodium channel protein type 4 subunit alpha B n=1 Tax=Acrasis kona TaxID=1008807 RepID=A0AAW2ZDI9_9EUKA